MESMADAVIANRGLNFATPYGGQGNFLGDGSAVNANVNANRDISILESINETGTLGLLGNQIDRGHAVINGRIADGQNFLSNQISDQGNEFRFSNITAQFANVTSQFASMERQRAADQATIVAALHAQDIKAVECCCELKAGQATIIANQENARLQAAERENAALRTQILIQGNGNGNGNQGNG